MTRLYDRIMAKGAGPYRVPTTGPDVRDMIREEFEAKGQELSTDEFDRVTAFANASPDLVATETFAAALLERVPVFVGDEVARYTGTLAGIRIEDLVATLAPPFDRFFVEFQRTGVPNAPHAWGVLFEVLAPDEGFGWEGFDADVVAWEMRLTLIEERRKGDVFGPVARYYLALDSDGEWIRDAGGEVVWQGEHVPMTGDPPAELLRADTDNRVTLVFPALMLVSLLHCKNVRVGRASPPSALSRKHQKRYGRPLVRYETLNIDPMKQILDSEGQAQTRGLGFALHICRGHFKRFTEDAPLFGRHVGTYWWTPQARGRSERGEVIKDYRVRTGDRLGADYRPADEKVEVTEPMRKRGEPEPSPDSFGRGLRAHSRTQNALAKAVSDLEHIPRSPSGEDDRWDLLWEAGDTVWVAEVKSLTDANEERQLRIALGQVKRYAQRLASAGLTVQPVIAVERQPSDDSWLDLCNTEGIVLVWPEAFGAALS